MKFGALLRGLLEERELSQKQLASDLNISPSTVGNYIQNTREPDFNSLRRIAEYFGVTCDYLLGCTSGSEERLSGEERELLRIFRALDGESRDLMLEQGRAILKLRARRGAGQKQE